ncbi:MAG: CDP-alcohol phosphatidyltransferase family protein [Acidimicrobiales bacterium]
MPGPPRPTRPAHAGAVESRAATDVLLAGLRDAGWGPASWGRFALSTSARSAHQAWEHPRAAAEVSALHLALAAAAGPGRRRWVALSWLMAVTHLGMLGPRRSLGAASALTLVRANLPALVPGTPWIGVVALASDKADGIVARWAGPTQFGHYADSLADAAFWAWFAWRHEQDRRLVATAGLAWVLPVAAVTAISFARGQMVEAPRSAWLRPAAAMQALLAARALRSWWAADAVQGRRRAQGGRPPGGAGWWGMSAPPAGG